MQYLPKILKLANNNVTVAISGGVDSFVAVHCLQKAVPRLNIQVFHFNHKLRPQNDEMEVSCRKFAQDMRINLVVKERDTSITGIVLREDYLRQIRYAAMKDLGYVITGHHLDDAVESHFLNFCNGVENYIPMPLVTVYDNLNFTVIRPLILNTRKDICEYAEKHDLYKFVVEDETNVDTTYRRNWARHDILPLIKTNYNLHTIVRKRYIKYLKDNF